MWGSPVQPRSCGERGVPAESGELLLNLFNPSLKLWKQDSCDSLRQLAWRSLTEERTHEGKDREEVGDGRREGGRSHPEGVVSGTAGGAARRIEGTLGEEREPPSRS